MEPRKGKKQAQCKKNLTFKQEHGIMDKAVAIFAIAFFIFYGIPMPTSYATAMTVAQNERQQLVPVVSYDPAAAAAAKEAVTPQPEIPSGAAIQNSNALSPVTDSVVVDGDPSPAPTPAQGDNAQLLSVIRVRAGESIQAAIDQAKSGDTVYVDAGVYTQSFVLKQGVNLQGENPETTILDGGGRNEDLIIAMGDNRIDPNPILLRMPVQKYQRRILPRGYLENPNHAQVHVQKSRSLQLDCQLFFLLLLNYIATSCQP